MSDYLTAEQYEYARKTGDWESGKVLTHGQALNENQQIVLEWLKEAYKRTKWSSPFGTVYSTINTHELFVRTRLTKAQQYQVLAAFAEWGIANAEE